MSDTPRPKDDRGDGVRVIARRRGPNAPIIALEATREAYVGEAIALRARLAWRLDELQGLLATYATFADRIAAVALAIEELDALVREDASA